jgi:hypothetical protein
LPEEAIWTVDSTISFTVILASLAALASAQNTIEFVNQDSTTGTVYFTQQGLASVDPVTITGLTNYTVTFPPGWIGYPNQVHHHNKITGTLLIMIPNKLEYKTVFYSPIYLKDVR